MLSPNPALPVQSSTTPTQAADEAAGIAAHAVQAHGGATQFLVGGLHGAGGQGRAVEINHRVPQHDQPAARAAGALALHPVTTDQTAALLMRRARPAPRPIVAPLPCLGS